MADATVNVYGVIVSSGQQQNQNRNINTLNGVRVVCGLSLGLSLCVKTTGRERKRIQSRRTCSVDRIVRVFDAFSIRKKNDRKLIHLIV